MQRPGGCGRIALLTCAVGLTTACGGGTSEEPTTPTPEVAPAEARPVEPDDRADCPELPGNAEEVFAEARAFEEQGGGSDEYEVLAKRIQLYGRAAAAGHLGGQAIGGPLLFTTLFTTDAPQPEEKEVYVEAIGYIFIAAMRGHPKALSFSSDVPKIVEAKQIPAELDMPFSDIDRAWLEAALANSVAWMACYGSAP